DQSPGDNAGVPHQFVDSFEIITRMHGSRIIGRKLVQQLRCDLTPHHATSSSAPWQLNPAPKLDMYHNPPAASSLSARSRMKYTHALLTLPYSRRMAALR